MLERDDGTIAGIEVKAAATVTSRHFAGLRTLSAVTDLLLTSTSPVAPARSATVSNAVSDGAAAFSSLHSRIAANRVWAWARASLAPMEPT